MTERKITTIEDPIARIGLPVGDGRVVLILNPESAHEVRIFMGAVQTMGVAQQMASCAMQLLSEHVEIVERDSVIETDSHFIDRDRPDTLDG